MVKFITRVDENSFEQWLLFETLPVVLPPTDWLWSQNESQVYAGLEAYAPDTHLFMGAFGAYLADLDPDEPDIDLLSEEDIPEIDAFLKSELSKQEEITKWMASQLNVKPWGKGLVTAYIALDEEGREIQHIATRTKLKGTRFVIQTSFDVEHKDETLVFMQILGSALAAC